MGNTAPPIDLTAEEWAELQRLVRTPSTPQQTAQRAQMILLAAAGLTNAEIGDRLGVWRKTVSHWRSNWADSLGSPATVHERLSDAPRCGAPARITPEQICAIVALACEPPERSNMPVSHWTQQALADEAMRRGIIDQISQRSVGRILKRSRPQAASRALLADAQT